MNAALSKKRLAVLTAIRRGEARGDKLPYVLGMTPGESADICAEMADIGIRLDGRFEHVSVPQAAYILTLNPRRVREFCEDDRLGRRVGNRWMIGVEELIQFAEVPRPVGGTKEFRKWRRRLG